MSTLTNVRNTISLYDFVNALADGLLPLAVTRGSFIVNEIDKNLDIEVDEHMLAYVLWNLLNRVIHSTQQECFRIDSVVENNCTMIRVKNAGVYFYRLVAQGFRQMQHVAEQLGGMISIDQLGVNGTTVALRLQHQLNAA